MSTDQTNQKTESGSTDCSESNMRCGGCGQLESEHFTENGTQYCNEVTTGDVFTLEVSETRLSELMEYFELSGCDLRTENIPTYGDDYDIEWVVFEHHMSDPKLREIGRGGTPSEALKVAFD